MRFLLGGLGAGGAWVGVEATLYMTGHDQGSKIIFL